MNVGYKAHLSENLSQNGSLERKLSTISKHHKLSRSKLMYQLSTCFGRTSTCTYHLLNRNKTSSNKLELRHVIHLLYIYYTSIIHLLYIYYTSIIHLLYIYYTYIIHILYIYFTCIMHILYIYYTYIIHILYIYHTYIIHISYIY